MGSVILGLAVFLFGGGFLVRSVSHARNGGAWAGPQTPKMRSRSQGTPRAGLPASRPIRHEIKRIWAETQAADWLKQREHDRTNGSSAAAPAPGRMRGRRLKAGVARVIPAARQSRPGQPAPPPPAHTPPPSPPPPVASRPASPSANGSSGRNTTVASSTGSAEKLIEGVNQVQAEAASGGIHAKHGAIKSCTEGSIRFSAMSSMMSRAMSEPGSNYGPEITEPLAKAATHLQAAAMAFSESDAALSTLLQMSVGDLASSSRQAPHHTELAENGSH